MRVGENTVLDVLVEVDEIALCLYCKSAYCLLACTFRRLDRVLRLDLHLHC